MSKTTPRAHWAQCVDRGERLQEAWQARFAVYRMEHPGLATEFLQMMDGGLPEGWDAEIPDLAAAESAAATRAWSGQVIQGLAARIPNLIGGSADLSGSNKTDIAGADSMLCDTPGGRIVHYGVREHAMGSVMNGMVLHGGIRPYGGTFLIFSDYMRPAIRLAGLMGQPVIYVFSHDSIGLGEDGPTHQPIEQLASLRAIPNVMDLRPGDGPETEMAWRVAVERSDGPSFLALSRQTVPMLDRASAGDGASRGAALSAAVEPTEGGLASAEGLRRGGYVLAEASTGAPTLVLIASGTELALAVESRERLEAKGTPTRVVSLPSWFLFQKQRQAYRDEVLPPSVAARVSIEAGSTFGWERWVGGGGRSIGLDRFGASAPAGLLFEKFGFTVDNVAATSSRVL